eukprot:363771-Chlamydomonas_euryale.AAC.19
MGAERVQGPWHKGGRSRVKKPAAANLCEKNPGVLPTSVWPLSGLATSCACICMHAPACTPPHACMQALSLPPCPPPPSPHAPADHGADGRHGAHALCGFCARARVPAHAAGRQRGRRQDHGSAEPAGIAAQRPLRHGHQLFGADVVQLAAGHDRGQAREAHKGRVCAGGRQEAGHLH